MSWQVGSGRGQITAYPRQLESLIRLAEAHAKMRFSASVELPDVEEAWRLHREALKQAATDPTSGQCTGPVSLKEMTLYRGVWKCGNSLIAPAKILCSSSIGCLVFSP